MKKFILAALIGATILTPLAASAQERGQWRGRGGEAREQGGGERPQRQWGGDRQRRLAQPDGAPQPRRDGGQRQPEGQRREWQGQRDADGQRRPWQGEGQAQRQPDGQRGDWRGQRDADGQRRLWQGQQGDRGQRGDWDQRRDDPRRDWQGRRDDRQGFRSDGRRDGGWRDNGSRDNGWRDQQARRGWDDNRNWNRGWRQDRRYDWGDYRRTNRNTYRLPRYYAPSGWNYGYRRFSIGLTLGSMLFSQNYWINDPFYYRLPPAYGPYRWVRYYNDALLVDIDTGQVVDVEYDIFW